MVQTWGICGRGVLIDYHAYAEAHGIEYCPGDTHNISIQALERVAVWEGVDFRPGDILLVRTGWTSWHDSLANDEAKMIALTRDRHNNAGLLAGEETAEWIWYVNVSNHCHVGNRLIHAIGTTASQLLQQIILPWRRGL